MAFQLNGQPISIDRPYVAPDGTKYANLRDPAIRTAVGVVEVADPEPYDQRFYWGVGNPKQLEDVTETVEDSEETITTKGLKSQWINDIKNIAGSMLAQTDWYIIRKAERNVDVPESVISTRSTIITEANRLETAISNCTTVEELIEIVSNQNWS